MGKRRHQTRISHDSILHRDNCNRAGYPTFSALDLLFLQTRETHEGVTKEHHLLDSSCQIRYVHHAPPHRQMMAGDDFLSR